MTMDPTNARLFWAKQNLIYSAQVRPQALADVRDGEKVVSIAREQEVCEITPEKLIYSPKGR